MSGLEVDQQVILEIASVVTDGDLQIVAQGPEIAIHHPQATLLRMEAWSREHHQRSGLLDRVRASGCSSEQAEEETLAFLRSFCRAGESPLCGNSVWQDRRFLLRHMPRLEGFLHYRNIDVSSLKELVRSWYPQLPRFEKRKQHLAMSDILESIQELRYYRSQVFVPAAG